MFQNMASKQVVYVFSFCILGYFLSEGRGMRYLCGENFQIYDISIESCVNGQVVQRNIQTSITSTTERTLVGTVQSQLNETESVPDNDPKQNRIPRRLCRDYADLMSCNGNVYCGRHDGYKCCGFESFNPKTQTCCQQTSSVYRIHDEKPEKHHVCCQLDVHKRGSPNVSCAHASVNDKFLLRPERLNNIRKDLRLCSYEMFVFRIDIGKIKKKQRDVTAVVKMWEWLPKTKIRMKKRGFLKKKMRVTFDKYSKRSKLSKTKNSFLLISDYNILKDSFLYLKANDILYKSPKKHAKMVRILRNIQNKCGN